MALFSLQGLQDETKGLEKQLGVVQKALAALERDAIAAGLDPSGVRGEVDDLAEQLRSLKNTICDGRAHLESSSKSLAQFNVSVIDLIYHSFLIIYFFNDLAKFSEAAHICILFFSLFNRAEN